MFFRKRGKVIPNTLRRFLDNVVLSDEQRTETADKFLSKIVGIAHAIISCVRPRSFISSLKIGLGAALNKKFGSKSLLNILSSLGFCCSYDEALLFEASVVSAPNNAVIDPESFSQFVFNNADQNVNTIDGLHTFHAMGGIECVTPASAVACEVRIPKLKAIPSRDIIGSFGTLPLETFHGYKEGAGLENVPVENLSKKNPAVRYDFDISSADLLWIYNHRARFVDLQDWNGFMEKLTADMHYQKSRIVCLPFLEHPPNNYDAIYTVLSYAAERIENKKQKVAFVTLDQPLYLKAKEIIHSTDDPKLRNVVVRLGGFHLAMSFLGSIGHIMDGSGLKELFSEIYAPAFVDKILAGHAYSRAVRAHILVHCALVQMIITSADFTDEETTKLRTILENPDSIFENINANEELQNIKTKFIETVNRIAGRSDTAKLWTQYLHMVSLLKSFIEAERSGNWQLHLHTLQRMLPFFHATGDYLYAKSAHLYLQDMYNLKERMDGHEYEKFVNGGFTIRRTDKFWSGIWSDMTIEQKLMRAAIKDSNEPTPDRGMTDSVLSKWVLTTPALIDLIERLAEFCKVNLVTTDPRVDSRATRIARDVSDIVKVLSWFQGHNPFPETEGITSLSSGLKGGKDDHINCHEALEIGVKSLTEMWEADKTGNPRSFNDVKYRKKHKVIPLKALTSTIQVDDINFTIDPLLLYRRISRLKKSDERLQSYYELFELAPYPLSLFDENGMLKGNESEMYECFVPVTPPAKGNDIFVIDGGFFLRKVAWQEKEIFDDILNRYVNYLTDNYSKNCVVVFDGFPENAAEKYTKSAQRLRRARLISAPEFVCDLHMPSTLPQDKFLSNPKNEARLTDMLSHRLRNDGFQVRQAVEDADSLIVETALSLSDSHDTVYIVGEDVDLVVILTQVGQDKKNVYVLKPSRKKIEQTVYYSVDSFKFPEIRHFVCFMHAFTGCDTTSAIRGQEKLKLVRLMNLNKNGIQKYAQIFNNPNASLKSYLCAEYGRSVMMTLYGAEKDVYHYSKYRSECSKRATVKKKFNLYSLPPTIEACDEHVLRTFLQVCEWRGDHTRDPTEWGWKKENNILVPITCRMKPIWESIWEELFDEIHCACHKGECPAWCECRKAGLRCSVLCRKCHGQRCSNVDEPYITLSDDEIEDDSPSRLNDDADHSASELNCPVVLVESQSRKKKISETSENTTKDPKKRRT